MGFDLYIICAYTDNQSSKEIALATSRLFSRLWSRNNRLTNPDPA